MKIENQQRVEAMKILVDLAKKGAESRFELRPDQAIRVDRVLDVSIHSLIEDVEIMSILREHLYFSYYEEKGVYGVNILGISVKEARRLFEVFGPHIDGVSTCYIRKRDSKGRFISSNILNK